MALAHLIAEREDDVICDLAQAYHVTDYRALPVRTAAALVFGLGEESRTVRGLTGRKYTLEQMLMADMVDRLSLLLWKGTKDAQHGRNRPVMLRQLMAEEKKEPEAVGFDTPEEFRARWKEFTRK